MCDGPHPRRNGAEGRADPGLRRGRYLFTHPRGWRILTVLAFAVLLTVQIPAAGMSPQWRTDRQGAAPQTVFRTDADPTAVGRSGAEILEAYPAFVVARGSEASLASLRRGGHSVDELPGRDTIYLSWKALDAKALRPAEPAAWSLDARGHALGIVHFHAPVKAAWTGVLESRGVEVLRYLPEDAFLVRGPPEALVGLRDLAFVDGVGEYRSEWKIRPNLTDLAGDLDVRILLAPGSAPEAVAAWLGHRGLSATPREAAGPGIVGAFGAGDFRWIRARIPPAFVRPLADLPEVEFIEAVRPVRLANADTDWVLQTYSLAGNSSRDLRYWWQGLNGQGQVIGLSDTGLDYDHNQFRESAGTTAVGDLYNVTDGSRRKVVRYVNMGVLTGQVDWPGGANPWDPWSIEDSDHQATGSDCTFGHGTPVSSVLGGNDNWVAGGGGPNDGNALGAKLYVEDIGTVGPDPSCVGDTDVLQYLPEDFTDLFGPPGLVYEDPAAPVRIHSNSWGTDSNEYDIQARMVDAFVWSHPDLVVLFASGNAGPAASTVGTPGTAKNLLTVGGAGNPDAVQAGGPNDLMALTSRGPTSDGRIKPTLLSVFDGDSAMSDGNVRSGTGLPDSHWQGTSYATPAAAAAAAIVRQYLAEGWYPTGSPVPGNARNPSAALLRALLVASAVQITGSGAVRGGEDTWPNNEQGFGRILLSNVLPLAAYGDTFRTRAVDQAAGLTTGEDVVYRFRVASSARPMKVVVTWTDYPATLGAAKALVNDLDLEVTAPDGTVYRGNVFGTFANGQSVAGGTFDSKNVEEAVLVKAPAVGEWTVRVIASDVPVGPQPFALVATGELDAAYGQVGVDRTVYGEADTIRIEVEDADAASVQVLVRSGFESAGESVSLTGSPAAGVWRGAVPTALGPAAGDGVLQVRDGDLITVAYDDATTGRTATAVARVDAVGPTISAVSADRAATTSVRIRWDTDEPATSGIRFGTSPLALSGSVDLPELRTVHEARLTGLQADILYYFDVVSRDRLGHETRDANAGRHYGFRTAAYGDVLVVIGDGTFPPEREASYEAALGARGWTWSFWRAAEAGPPTLNLLRSHRAVVWQVGLEQYPPFNASNRALLKAYLDGGGRLLVTSHDTAWALGEPTSGFWGPDTESWLRGVLKASLDCDPTTVGQVTGTAGDPISGAYTGGVAYVPHRDGGADDEIFALSMGGTTATLWRDGSVIGCSPGSRPVGLRWVSSVSNGSAGVGAWGGTPSRLVYFAFELTGVDATAGGLNVGSGIRAQILDNALRWLVSSDPASLDRDHPDVRVTTPNGGVWTAPDLTVNWTANGTGAALAGFTVQASADLGQTWTPLASLPGTARSYLWDVRNTENGDGYLVRIAARDAGNPALYGEDESDAPFAILRLGGDTEGPRIWAGSVRVGPNPPGAASVVRINATADDEASGGSAISAAELFLTASEPLPADDGLGVPMDPVDESFDAVREDLTWSGSLAIAPGASCVWVHALDAEGTWGPYESACFVVVSVGPDVTPPAAAQVESMRLANGGADVEIVWGKAWDDSQFGGTTLYQVLRSTTPRGPTTDVSGPIPATGASTYTFVDAGAGSGDPSDYFYRVQTADGANNTAVGSSLAAKVRITAAAGPNLLGIPLEPGDPSLGSLAAGLAWSDAWAYSACLTGFPWRSAVPSEGAGFLLGLGQGFWLNASAAGSLLLVGAVPAAVRVTLCAGWNLVGFPGFSSGVTVAAVATATQALELVSFDPAGPFHLRTLGAAEVLTPGQGFWIRVPEATTWVLAGF